jgi:hypothetical protein
MIHEDLPLDRPNIVPEVAKASDETLVSALIVLTHRIDASSKARVAELDRTGRLRLERDLVRAEILRRMGEAR